MNYFTLTLLIGVAGWLWWRYYGPGRRKPVARKSEPVRREEVRRDSRAADPAITQLEYDPKTGTYKPQERQRERR